MRITSILLLTFILLLSCKKDSGIPDKYSFLLGEWHCYNCTDETNVTIKKNYLKIISTGDRGGILFLKNIKEHDSFNGVYLTTERSDTHIHTFSNVTDSIYILLDSKQTPYNYPIGLYLKRK